MPILYTPFLSIIRVYSMSYPYSFVYRGSTFGRVKLDQWNFEDAMEPLIPSRKLWLLKKKLWPVKKMQSLWLRLRFQFRRRAWLLRHESLVPEESIAPETEGLDPKEIVALEESIAPDIEDPVPEERVAPEVKMEVLIFDPSTPAPITVLVS